MVKTLQTKHKVPALVELEDKARKLLVDGIKKVILRLQDEDKIDRTYKYSEILAQPDLLMNFMQTYRANRELCQDIVINKKGQPIHDDNEKLPCGITLNQVCQMLVFTAAKRQMKGAKNESKLLALTSYLAYDWQLPLLKAYDFLINEEQIAVLGDALLDLRTRQSIEIIASYNAETIRNVKYMVTVDRFYDVVAQSPESIAGLALCRPDEFKIIDENLGDRVWEFFAREEHYIRSTLEQKRPIIKVLGEDLVYIVDDLFYRIRRLPVDRAVILLERFKLDYGHHLPDLFSDPDFLGGVFKTVVEYLYMVEGDDHLFRETTRLKMNALKEVIAMYLKSRGIRYIDKVGKNG